MKTKLLTLTCVLGLMSVNAFANQYKSNLYEVSIQNLTTGQPLTPALLAVHSHKVKIATLGTQASEGLAALAKDGMTAGLESELAMKRGVVRTKVGAGIILPGQTEKIVVEANNKNFKLSLVSMLARTNDAIAVIKSASLNLLKGQKTTLLANIYDAGVELNTESCSDIPAPPCNNPGMGTSEDSFIRPHAGIQNIGDLNATRDAFSNIAAKVTIKRIH